MIVVRQIGSRKICMEWKGGLGLMNRYLPYQYIRIYIPDTKHTITVPVITTTEPENQDAVCKAVDKLVKIAKEMKPPKHWGKWVIYQCARCGETFIRYRYPKKASWSTNITCKICGFTHARPLCANCREFRASFCMLQPNIIDLSICPAGKWHSDKHTHVLHKYDISKSLDITCPDCETITHINVKASGKIVCSNKKCYAYLGKTRNGKFLSKTDTPKIVFNRTAACRHTLKHHHEELQHDPERLTTKFLSEIVGCRCKVVESKNETKGDN